LAGLTIFTIFLQRVYVQSTSVRLQSYTKILNASLTAMVARFSSPAAPFESENKDMTLVGNVLDILCSDCVETNEERENVLKFERTIPPCRDRFRPNEEVEE
jgi:hypothetical protein